MDKMCIRDRVVVDHPLRGRGTLGDGIHTSPGQALLDELRDGGLENALAGLLRIVLTYLAHHLGRLGGQVGNGFGHTAMIFL